MWILTVTSGEFPFVIGTVCNNIVPKNREAF